MIILTDSKDFTEKTFNIKPDWEIDNPRLDEIVAKLSKRLLPGSILFSTEIEFDSTWKYAFVVNHAPQSQYSILMEVLRNNTNFNEGILCLAGSGKNFRGYRKRKWQSLAGNIHLSAFLNPGRPVKNFHIGFTILSAVSVLQSIDAVKGLKDKSSIKWVNDILIDKAKVSGVLTQTQTQGDNVTGVFIGIGLNVKTTPQLEQDRFVPVATSLNNHAPCSETEVLANLLKNISKNYRILIDGGYHEILNIYRERSIVLGKEVTVYSDPFDGSPQIIAKGKVTGIGANLELWLENQSDPVLTGRITF